MTILIIFLATAFLAQTGLLTFILTTGVCKW